MSENDPLQQAYQLIRTGEKTEAVKLLLPIVRADPDNADAWWLLANAVDKSDQARRALQQVLKVRPNDQRARRFLEQLGGTPPARRTPPTITFDEDVPFTTSGAPAVYESDSGTDDLSTESDVWRDPFATDSAKRSGGAARTVDPDLNFKEDPFAPDNPTVPLLPAHRTAQPARGGQARSQPRRAAQPARGGQARSQPRRAAQPARGGQARRPPARQGQGRGQRRPTRPIALPGVEEFTEDPFAPDSKVLQARSSIGLLTIVILTVLLALIVVGIVLVLNNQTGSRIGSTSFSVVVTLDGSGRIFGDLPLESLALTALVDPRAVEGALGTAVADPETMATLMAQITAVPSFIGGGIIPADARKLGRIEVGQTVSETVDTFISDSWTFNGNSGQTIIIELDARDTTLDPRLSLFSTSGELLSENDDINLIENNRNSRIVYTPATDGDYIIIVSAFGTGGEYELRLLPG